MTCLSSATQTDSAAPSILRRSDLSTSPTKVAGRYIIEGSGGGEQYDRRNDQGSRAMWNTDTECLSQPGILKEEGRSVRFLCWLPYRL